VAAHLRVSGATRHEYGAVVDLLRVRVRVRVRVRGRGRVRVRVRVRGRGRNRGRGRGRGRGKVSGVNPVAEPAAEVRLGRVGVKHEGLRTVRVGVVVPGERGG
jgi:hypothetical protein